MAEILRAVLPAATLQTLLQGKPQDLRLRQLLMQRQLLRGDVAGAEATLRPLLAARDPTLRRAGERLHRRQPRQR